MEETINQIKNMKYRVITDAVRVEIEAGNTDEAARKFAQQEALFRGLGIESEADLMDEVEKMGGWCNIVEA